MIPHSSAGVQPWAHPRRTASSGPARVDASQEGVPSDPPEGLSTPQSQSRLPAGTDLTPGFEAQDQEPRAKRPRLDTPTGDASPRLAGNGERRNTLAFASAKPPASWRTRPAWSFHALVSEGPGGNAHNAASGAQSGRPASPPPLPGLPWMDTLDSDGLGPSISREHLSKEVQTTPYRIQVPTAAPVLKNESKCPSNTWRTS